MRRSNFFHSNLRLFRSARGTPLIFKRFGFWIYLSCDDKDKNMLARKFCEELNNAR